MTKKTRQKPMGLTGSVKVDPAVALVVDAFATQRDVTYGGKVKGA